MEMKLQEAIDQFITSLTDSETIKIEDAEVCMELFADYLLHYSDLFHDEIEVDEASLVEWEAALEGYIEKLFEGDTEPTAELGVLPLSMLDSEHLRDFLGWYLLREPDMDSLEVEKFVLILRAWTAYMHHKSWLSDEQCEIFYDVVDEVAVESARAAKAAHLLLYYVRLGAGVSPRLRGKRFDSFVEGHARIERVEAEKKSVWFGFDNQDKVIGPICLPSEIISHLAEGDVLDVELGQRGGQWIIVDIGPVYPGCIYVEADELDVPNKLI